MNRIALYLWMFITSTVPLMSQSGWTHYLNYDNAVNMFPESEALWVVSPNGLVQYDIRSGKAQVYSAILDIGHHPAEASILRDRNGNLWLAANNPGGALQFHRGNWLFHPLLNSAQQTENVVGAIALDSTGAIWMGGYAGTIAHFDGEEWHVLAEESGYQSMQVAGLFVESSGVVWALGSDGNDNKRISVARIEGNSVRMYTPEDGLPPSNGFTVGKGSIAEDSTGRIWIANGGGLSVYNGSTWELHPYSPGAGTNAPATYPAHIMCSRSAVWVAGTNGISRYDGNEWTNYTTSDGIETRNRVLTLSLTPEGEVLAGTDISIVKFAGEKWERHPWLQDADTGRRYTDILPHAEGLFVRADYGIVLLREGGKSEYRIENTVASNFIRDITADKNGNIWVLEKLSGGGYENSIGIGKFDGTHWRHFPLSSEIAFSNLFQCVVDAADRVWCSGQGGLLMFDGQWHAYVPEELQGFDPWFQAIALDSTGNVLVSSLHKPGRNFVCKVFSFDGANWKDIGAGMGSPLNSFVDELVVGADGRIWGVMQQLYDATSEMFYGGLAEFDGERWREHTIDGQESANQLISVGLTALPDGSVSFISNYGNRVRNFDGHTWSMLRDNNGDAFEASSLAVDRAGKLWLAGKGGIARYDRENELIWLRPQQDWYAAKYFGTMAFGGEGQIFSILKDTGLLCYGDKRTSVTGAGPENKDIRFVVYPNPCNYAETGAELYVNIQGQPEGQYEIELIDTRGRALSSLYKGFIQSGMRELSLHLPSGFPAGIYFLRLRGGTLLTIQQFVLLQ